MERILNFQFLLLNFVINHPEEWHKKVIPIEQYLRQKEWKSYFSFLLCTKILCEVLFNLKSCHFAYFLIFFFIKFFFFSLRFPLWSPARISQGYLSSAPLLKSCQSSMLILTPVADCASSYSWFVACLVMIVSLVFAPRKVTSWVLFNNLLYHVIFNQIFQISDLWNKWPASIHNQL